MRVFATLFTCTLFFCCTGKPPLPHQINNQRYSNLSTPLPIRNNKPIDTHGQTSSVRMRQNNGVYFVPIKVNGVDMEFIFDTGASDITISLVEALFLQKQGKLKAEDVLGMNQYMVADGSIAEGYIVNLKTVQIADKILYNVQASVVDNIQAPLLLGQSALSRFGKISIDYNRSIIEFK